MASIELNNLSKDPKQEFPGSKHKKLAGISLEQENNEGLNQKERQPKATRWNVFRM